jgi:hypothetical protein
VEAAVGNLQAEAESLNQARAALDWEFVGQWMNLANELRYGDEPAFELGRTKYQAIEKAGKLSQLPELAPEPIGG